MSGLALDITTLFPSESQPQLGLFVQRRAAALAALRPLHIAVGIGRFPLVELHPRYRNRRRTPQVSQMGDVRVDYVRYLSVPRVLKHRDGLSFANAVLRRVITQQQIAPTVLLAELAFPDGLAAMLLARKLRLPYVVTLRGHDINDLPSDAALRRMLLETLRSANAVSVVADALGHEAIRLGVDESRVHTVPNGVDSSIFGGVTRIAARSSLGIPSDQKLFVSVGHLVERKGHHLAIAALRMLEERHGHNAHLAVIGGPSEEGDATAIVDLAISQGRIGERVRLLGSRPSSDVATWIAAADALVLASSKEGRPNVVLESLCTGTPVVATRVWGTPELVSHEDYGILVDRDAASIAAAMEQVLVRQWKPDTIARWGRSFSWDRTARRLQELLCAAEVEGPLKSNS